MKEFFFFFCVCECASVGGEVKKHGRGVLQKKKKKVLQPEEMPRCKARVCVCVCGSVRGRMLDRAG